MIGGLISTALSANLDLAAGNGLIAGALCTGVQRCDDFIFEIEVTESGILLPILMAGFYSAPNHPSTGLYQSVHRGVIYNLRDADGNKVTKETNPELFTDNLLEKGLLQEDLVEYDKDIFLRIDWGDGERSEYSKTEQAYNTDYFYDKLQPDSNKGKHSYSKPGKYTVKVSGFCTLLYIQYEHNRSGFSGEDAFLKRGWKLTKIISFGDLDNTVLNYTYTAAVIDKAQVQCRLPFNKLSRVRVINYVASNQMTSRVFYNHGNDLTFYKSTFEADAWTLLGGDDFFHHFPKLIDAGSAMYCSNAEYVPDHCCSDNKYLQNAVTMFGYNALKRIGDRAFADLENLVNVNSIFYSDMKISGDNYDDILTTWDNYIGCLPSVGSSVFENCVSLCGDVHDMIMNWFYYTFTVGNEQNANGGIICGSVGSAVFKNCRSIKEVQFVNLLSLSRLGDELFSGCESLETANIYGNVPDLEYIGKNMFSGCKNLHEMTFQFSLTGSIPPEIPDNFLFDVEYREEKTYRFNGIQLNSSGFSRVYTPSYYINQYGKPLQELELGTFYGILNYISSYEITTFRTSLLIIEKYRPDLYSRMLDIRNSFPTKSLLKIGKNFFSEKFLRQEMARCAEKKQYIQGPHLFDYGCTVEIDDMHEEIYNLSRGEAIPYWKFESDYGTVPGTNTAFGYETYGTTGNGYSYSTPMPVQYDNVSEIPYLEVIVHPDGTEYHPMNGFRFSGYRVTRYDNSPMPPQSSA